MSPELNLFLFTLSLLSLVGYRIWSDRGWRDREEQAMVQRVSAVLDDVEPQDPEFVAEARELRDVLVPNAWAMRVATEGAKSRLSADAKVAITRAIYPHRNPAGATV